MSWRVSNQRGASGGSASLGGGAANDTSAIAGKLAMARKAQSLVAQEVISSQGVSGGASSSQQSPWSQGTAACSVDVTVATGSAPVPKLGSVATTDCTSNSIARTAILKCCQRRRVRCFKDQSSRCATAGAVRSKPSLQSGTTQQAPSSASR